LTTELLPAIQRTANVLDPCPCATFLCGTFRKRAFPTLQRVSASASGAPQDFEEHRAIF
jgi:hypothetical protein